MFTGIIEAVGSITQRETRNGDTRLWINVDALDMTDVAVGDSICVSGVCLTVVEHDGNGFAADVSVETLTCTTMHQLKEGDRVNLEKSVRLADRLGGHLVSGHVDGVGRVIGVDDDARSQRWRFEIPATLARYVAAKGSVCIDGVSLTVNEVGAVEFGVNLIPHTIAMTTFSDKRAGDPVNIEVDMIARYLERLSSYPTCE